MPKRSTLDDVLSRLSDGMPGPVTWFSRLPPDVQEELNAVRDAFDPQRHQWRSYAKAIIAVAEERGWPVAGEQGVIRWLRAGR